MTTPLRVVDPSRPLRRQHPVRVAAVPPADARVLVVEDDECMRALLRLHLRNAGYEVETAEDAVVAMKSIMRRPPDLMVVDVDMPYMDGLEFGAACKDDPQYSHIPLIFLTAREDVDDAARKLGALACLHKPLFSGELICAVARALPDGRFAIG